MKLTDSKMEVQMDTFINWTSQVAIAGRIVERRRDQDWNELGDYHLPFGRNEARAEAAKWLCQV